MTRKRTEWKFRGNSLTLGERTLIVGILNVTPDSFSDGGRYDDPEAAVQRALELQAEGADILDIGAESTKPGSERISEAEESRRLIPVLKKLNGKLDIPISVDTYKPGIAELAFKYGVSIINDVSALTWEPDLAKVVLHGDAGIILSHTRGRPEQWARIAPLRDVMGEIASELEASVHRALRAGIDVNHIVVDPGVGFGKRGEQNSEILARLSELRRLNLPILVGPSRKSFLSQQDPRALDFATAAAVTTAILNGAYLVRVHDVAAMKAVVQTADAIIAAIPEPVEEVRERRPAREAVRQQEREEEERKRPIRPPAARKQPVEPAPPAPPPVPREERRPWARSGERTEDRRAPRRDREREDDRGGRPPYRGDRPPARGGSWGDRPPRPPRRDDSERPQRSGPPRDREGRPPRRDEERPSRSGPPRGGEGRPPRRDDERPSRSGPPRGGQGRPPRRDDERPARSGPPRGGQGRPTRRDDERPSRSGPPRGRDDRPPRRDDDRPPRPPGRGGRPPGGRPPGAGGRGPSTPRRRG